MDPTLKFLEDKVAIVTGASAGIGVAIVEALVCRGLQVVGLARRREKLEELEKRLQNKNGKFYFCQADISSEEEIVNAFEWTKKNVGPVHILINNAGILRQKGLVDGDIDSWRKIFETNVLGLCIATKLAINEMQASNINGHIIHINSIAGHIIPNLPELNVYPASKYAVTALTETLRRELISLGSKIKVTSISPGSVLTELGTAAGIELDAEQQKILEATPLLNPQDVADSVVYALSTPQHVQVHEIIIRPLGETF